MKISLTIFTFILIITSCQKNKLAIEILKSKIVLNLPSASGIVSLEDDFYLIGDDSPYLFHTNINDEIISKLQIYSSQNLKNGRINKKDKPDFESLELINQNELVAFGSGSKSPERNIFLRILLKDTVTFQKYNISSFYDNLKKLKILENEDLNIEAVAFQKDQIYLFNRGKNIIFTFNYKDLIAYLNGLIPFPKMLTTLFYLPKIDGIEAGFSGATILKDKSMIIFTSSVENTNNAYDDGEILGSFIGTIEISDNKISNSYKSVIIPNIKKPLKVESVTIVNKLTSSKYEVALVTDDDKGSSMKIDCLIKW